VDDENIVNEIEDTEATEPTGTEETGTGAPERPVQLQGKRSTSDQNRFLKMPPMDLHGRRQIFTNEKDITRDNVLRVLNKALETHQINREEEIYLEKYARGVQPILDRVKVYNKEICNRIVVNIASQIVAFKKAEFAGEPIQYVSRGKSKQIPEKIETLNSMMLSEGKKAKDLDLAGKMFTYGVGYRLVIQDQGDEDDEFDEAPFEIYIPDPRNTFVVRYNDVSKRVVMGVTYVYLDEAKNKVRYTVYTKNVMFVIDGSSQRATKIVDFKVHNFGMVTLIEYPCNSSYMGAFEVVLPLLDAINLTQSNRLDGVEQFVQALMVFDGVDVTREQFLELKDLGAIKLPPTMEGGSSGKKLYYLNDQLDQSQTQTLVDDMYQTVLQIVGMPSQGNANTSDSSNNGAMIVKNGWWNAEARAQETEGHWTESETDFLRVVLKMCSDSDSLTGLKVSDVEPKFGRRSYEDKLVKTQSFTTLLDSGVPPIQAYKYSGLDSDPEAASLQYEEYREQQDAKAEKKIQEELDAERERIRNADKENARTVPDRGSEPSEPEQDDSEEN
jgi:SPP1 family phage portal protein